MENGFVSKPIMLVATAGVLALGLSGYVYMEKSRPPVLEIFIFSLKSGQSMLIRTPGDKRYLIDGGSGTDIVRNVSAVLPFYTRRIDALMATDSLDKNAGGLVEVAKRYDVGRAYVPKYTAESLGLAAATSGAYATLLETVSGKNIPLTYVADEDRIELDEDIWLQFLFPASPDSFTYSRASPPEVLFRVSYGTHSAVFMGYASTKIQKSVIVEPSSVLIVSHSALPANMARELMARLRPEYLVYSRTVAKQEAKPARKGKTGEKKMVPDPLASIMEDHRFNLKEGGTTRVELNGSGIGVKYVGRY